jgi:hypothetical protein
MNACTEVQIAETIQILILDKRRARSNFFFVIKEENCHGPACCCRGPFCADGFRPGIGYATLL